MNNKLNKCAKIVILLILTLSSIIYGVEYTSANEENINSYDYIKLNITNDIEFQLEIERDSRITKFEVLSYFFPQSFKDAQYLNSFQTSNNNYKIINNSGIYSIIFEYDKDSLNTKNVIRNQFIVESTKYNPKITKKVKYPPTNINEKDKEYLNFGELIDIDDEISKQASVLASGQDDTYIVASKIAKWIKEDINYDLSTVTENPNQKSSEVFESKAGVCKEISNLYISMMRSLGIPARIVTGYAYTDSQELVTYLGSNWGGHAWVEVLIGDVWVPFDLTYNQYGYIDATHIILDKSANIKSNNLYINSTGYGYKFVGATKSSSEFGILDKKQYANNDLGVNINIEGPNELGFGSYGYIKVNMENTDNFYKILFLRLSKVAEVENIDSVEKMVIFTPNEKKETYFRYKIQDDLKSNYQYIFPFAIYSDKFEKEYDVAVKEDYMTIKKIALPQDTIDTGEFSKNDLNFDCNFILEKQTNKILCSIKNPNNYEINNINVCLNNTCQKINLRLNEVKTITFDSPNFKEVLDYNYNNISGNIDLEVSRPILLLDYDNTINDDNFFKMSYSIENYGNGVSVQIYLDDTLIKNLDSKQANANIQLREGDNKILVRLYYYNRVFDEKEFNIRVKSSESDVSLSFWERVKKFFRNLFED